MKDYYDIYYLANKFDFDGATLTKALGKTFENRGHTFTAEQFEQVMTFDDYETMKKKWKAFVRKIDIKIKRGKHSCLSRFICLCNAHRVMLPG